ncbi:MAG: methionine--tRNA ligase [Aggregatilineales bacterium]
MAEHILVSVAWPYANGDLHVGHLAGALLPADIFARYHRLKGDHVLMVSGSDAHGTPILVEAEKRGTTPRQLFEEYHAHFLDTHRGLGISYDLFTHTDTENHTKIGQDIFLKLLQGEDLYRASQKLLYSETEKRFLPDRYVEGTCPVCGYAEARGDQCDNCGSILEAVDLINPRSKIDGSRPVVREAEHYFLDLKGFIPRLREFLLARAGYWRPNVLPVSQNKVEHLVGRPITRDIDWGIPVPLPGWEGKRLYVWFEAVMGYLSASIEWANNNGQPDAWRLWWYNPDAKTYYFIGKDNIEFHTIFWPAELMGSDGLYRDGDSSTHLNLPYDVPANEFMNVEGKKFSKSHNWAVWLPDMLTRYDPDAIRYCITAAMPESKDSDFSWTEFVQRNNNELVAKWGNLVNRVLTYTMKNFDGVVPTPGELHDEDQAILARAEADFATIGRLLDAVKIRAALQALMALTDEANAYLERRAPWKRIKEDRADAGTIIYTALQVIDHLKTLWAPFLPFTSQQLHEYLGYDGELFGTQQIVTYQESTRAHQALIYDGSRAIGHWQPSALPSGQKLRTPQPLFKKLGNTPAEEAAIVESERARLGK